MIIIYIFRSGQSDNILVDPDFDLTMSYDYNHDNYDHLNLLLSNCYNQQT